MATASFRRPSPNIIENNLGYSSNLTIVIAAIISEEHKIEQKYIIYKLSNYHFPPLLSWKSNILNAP